MNRSIALFLGCVCAAGAMGCGPGGGAPIPLAPGACDVPLFIGEPASPSPLPPQFIPRHPRLAPQGTNGMHADSHCTDAYPWSGPLGVNPQVRSASMSRAGGLVATVAVDQEGRLVCVSGSLFEFRLLLLDPATLQILASHTLPQRASTSAFGINYYLVEDDTDAVRISIAFEEARKTKRPVAVLVADEYHGFNR